MTLTQTQQHQLARVLTHYYADEEKDYHERDTSSHIFLDIKALGDALNRHLKEAHPMHPIPPNLLQPPPAPTEPEAYRDGYYNGQTDRRHRLHSPRSYHGTWLGKWHGPYLQNYSRGYRQGYTD